MAWPKGKSRKRSPVVEPIAEPIAEPKPTDQEAWDGGAKTDLMSEFIIPDPLIGPAIAAAMDKASAENPGIPLDIKRVSVFITGELPQSPQSPAIAPQSLKEANDMLERQSLQEIVRVPAVPVSEAATGVVAELLPAAKHWQVSIKHNPALIVEAPTRAAAIEEYKRRRNIAWTAHVVECVELVEVAR